MWINVSWGAFSFFSSFISCGGFVCQECIGMYDQKLTVDVLKGFRHINKWQLEKY